MAKLRIGCIVICLFGVVQAKDLYRNASDAAASMKPSIGCREGFMMEGTFCVKRMTMPPKVVCEFGVLEGTECVNYYSASKECPPDHDLKGDKCMKTEEMLPLTVCQDDYVLDGVTCKSSRMLEPMCPRGTVEVEGNRCAMYTPSAKRCPAGFVSTGSYHKGRGGSKCVKTVSVPPTETCTKGFSLVSGSCILVKTIEPVCPYGSTDEGDKCAFYKAAAQRCKPEFRLLHSSGDAKCRKRIAEPATPKCDDDYVLCEDKKKCIKTLTVSPVCAAGHKETPDGRCVTYSASSATCSEGFSLSHASGTATCEKAVKIAPYVVCSDGYELSDSNCVKIVQSPMVCPAGSRAEGDRCVSESSALCKCDAPFHQTSYGEKKCLLMDVQDGVAGCTKDFVLSDKAGFCEKQKTCDPFFVCKEGAREESRCVNYIPAAPLYVCPDGFENSSLAGPSRCVQKITKDCSVVEYEVKCHDIPECFTKKCEEQYEVAQVRALRQLGGYKNHSGKFGRQICEKVAVNVPKTCEKTLFADAVMSCPAGSRAQGKGCISPKYHSLDVKCPEGVYDSTSNLCVKMYKKPAVYNCPLGYSKSVTGGSSKCSKPMFSELVYYCNGTDTLKDKSCHRFVDKVCEGGVCERTLVMLADVQCPDGYHVTPGSQEQGGSFGFCVTYQKTDVVYKCSQDSELVDGLRCAKYFPMQCAGGSCEVKTHSPVMFECREGLELLSPEPEPSHSHSYFSGLHRHNGMDRHYHGEPKCVSTLYEAPELFCSKSESSVMDGKCVKYAPKKCPNGKCEHVSQKPVCYTCPDGFKQKRDYDMHNNLAPMIQYGGKYIKDKKARRKNPMQIHCVAVEEAMFEHFCSKGEMSSSYKCAKYFEKACPNNRCLVTLSAAPQYKCQDGYSLDQKTIYRRRDHVSLCKSTLFQEPVFKCHKGESDATGRKCRKTSPPKVVCPKGASRSGGSCLVNKYEKPTTVYSFV